LIAVEDSLFQIVFIVLALIGWVIKSTVEEREKRKKQQQRTPVPPGQRPLPRAEPPPRPEHREGEAYHPLPNPEAPSPRPAPVPTPVATPTGGARLKEVHPQLEVLKIERLQARKALPGRDKTLVAEQAAKRRRLFARLGAGATTSSPRTLARAGVLWSEVLGPPRAVKGPHRPPHLDRHRR
jgi:hypothetical protein